VNTFLLAIHPYTDHRWFTLKQANELRGAVKPGEKATTADLLKHWKPNVPNEEQEPGGIKEVPLLRYHKVFNAEQCIGLSFDELHISEDYREHERIERAELLVRHMPNPPTIWEGGDTAW